MGKHQSVNLTANIVMTKSELIAALCKKNPNLSSVDVDSIVTSVFDKITQSLSENRRVELRGFGTFGVKHRESRFARNPKTGETVFVPKKSLPYFKTGKLLRDNMNQEEAA